MEDAFSGNARLRGPRWRLTAQAEPENVARRVGIAVNDEPAIGAPVSPLCEHLRDNRTAARAELRRSRGGHSDHPSTSLYRFVLEHYQKRPPALVCYVFRQKSPRKTTDIEILNGNQAELVDQASGQLMGMVTPEVANPLMLAGQ
jgi:hypothetical protein